MKKFCIVIPIYKEHLDCVEQLSLTQLWNVIGDKHYDIYFVRPDTEYFDMTEYYDLLPGGVNYVYEEAFDENYFKSTATYSQLCISYDFYNRFSDYEYMYIYQLDCYLNIDMLGFFCDFEYDYIGAPIISNNSGWSTTAPDGKSKPVIGNGGFSLRKISTFKEITDINGEFRTYYNITEDELNKIIYEDLYFCEFVGKKYSINIAPINIGFGFSWDMNVDVIYNIMNLTTLPMCIHAWDKNIRFWKDKLPNITQKIIDFCEEKHKDFFKVYYNDKNNTYKE